MPTARQVTWAKTRTLAVALAAIAIFSVLAYLLTGGTLLKETNFLQLYVPDATGIDQDSVVRVNGVDVGKVDKVSLSGSNQPDRVVRLELKVEREYLSTIPADAIAQINSDTAVGNKFVDIDTTQSKRQVFVKPNSEIAFKMQPDLMKTLDIQQFTARLRTAEAMLDDIESGKNLAGQLILSDEMYKGLLKQFDDLERDVQTISGKEQPLGKILYTDDLHRQFQEPLERLDRSLQEIQSGQGQLGKLLQDEAQYAQLRDQMTAFQHSIAGIQSNALLQSDQMYKDWSRQIALLIRSVDEANANPLFSSSEMYDNLAGYAKETRDTLREFRQNPQKFLRIKVF
jgi:phospholipid/cholesterol/gamma-HCH transport system substrate-binding protein